MAVPGPCRALAPVALLAPPPPVRRVQACMCNQSKTIYSYRTTAGPPRPGYCMR